MEHGSIGLNRNVFMDDAMVGGDLAVHCVKSKNVETLMISKNFNNGIGHSKDVLG